MLRSCQPTLLGYLRAGCAPYAVILLIVVTLSLGAAARALAHVRVTPVSASH
jgi:hypothetical protein